MRLLYLVSVRGNPLYGGRGAFEGRYLTYGQHGFIYDLVRTAHRHGFFVTLGVDDLGSFPLGRPLLPYCELVEAKPGQHLPPADLVLLDALPEAFLGDLTREQPVLCIVHNPATRYPDHLVEACDLFICMTEAGFAQQASRIPQAKLALIPQGVDTERFRPRGVESSNSRPNNRVLLYGRLDMPKLPTLTTVIEVLMDSGCQPTVLGEGSGFWAFSDRFGEYLPIINHIPCHSVHNALQNFDVIVSSGRGAMEGLACGLPTICAGLGYGGVITSESIHALLDRNLTGYGQPADAKRVAEDVETCQSAAGDMYRALALRYCSADRFLADVVSCVAADSVKGAQPTKYRSHGSVCVDA